MNQPRLILFLLTLSVYGHAQSVLSQGLWYKIAVTETGVHKLDASFLKKAGLSLSNVNPKNVRLFGNGGAMLPQKNTAIRPKDLQENAIIINGEADGRFDDTDFILFYGESPHKIWAKNGSLSHEINLYSDTTFYFLNVGNVAGLRIEQGSNPMNTSLATTITDFDDYQFIEKENINLVHSGRSWFGDLVTDTQSFDFKTDGIVPNSTFLLHISALGVAQTNTNFIIKINDKALGSLPFGSVGFGRYDIKGWKNADIFSEKVDGNSTQKINLQLNKNGQNNAYAYVDFVALQYKRKLQAEDRQTIFRSFTSTQHRLVNYKIDGANNTHQIWEVTNPIKAENQDLKNGSFLSESTELKTFVLFQDNNVFVPKSIRQIENQNLHNAETPDLLIITAPDFLNQAQKLADFRKKNDALEVSIFSTTQVFNEYSSGCLDPTAIRDFVRDLYHKNPAKLKYLLLFGDGTYDYKNNAKNPDFSANKYVPVYESRESLHPIYSFSSDDYFGFLEDSEGEWVENQDNDHSLEIGIGRLPAKTTAEAETLVNKLIRYADTKKTAGTWRNKVSFVADDGDFNIHQNDAIVLAKLAEESNDQIRTDKILLDAFPTVSSANGQVSPKTTATLQEAIEKGSLLINYNGHGDENGWTEEKVLTTANILAWKGINNLPVLLTATCQFGRYDDPNVVSGAELGVLSTKGFAIAMLTTTRPVFANTNFVLNQAFYRALNGVSQKRLGDIFRETKNAGLAGVVNRNFTLLGDPSLKLALPEQKIKLKPLNDTLKALSKIHLTGSVFKNDQINVNFEGLVNVRVFDKAQELETLGGKSGKIKYDAFPYKLFEGRATIKQGQFSIDFIVPKDIDYRVGKGRIELYAISQDSLSDAVGIETTILVGGSALVQADNTPPKISLHSDNQLLKNGDKINKNQALSITIYDENGLNISGLGLGHENLLIIDDTLRINLNGSFIYKNNVYQQGDAAYFLGALTDGVHRFKVLAYDTHNNLSEETFEIELFSVRKSIRIQVQAYPNPFSERIKFVVETEDGNQDNLVDLRIYDSSGRLVKQFDKLPLSLENELIWSANDTTGYPNTNGFYIFTAQLYHQNETQSKVFSGKIYYQP